MTVAGAITTLDDSPLSERLLSRGWEFDFFQAVWLLERCTDVRVPVGDRGPVGHESFRFRPDVSLGFPSTDIRQITLCTDAVSDASYYLVEVTFMGLYGVSTPLPLHYAIDILRKVEQESAAPADEGEVDLRARADQTSGSTPVRDFLDIFHHRLLSLFYRGWLKYRYDKSFGLANRDVITDYLLWLIGCPRGYDEATLGVPPIQLLRYAGTLTQRPKSAVALEGMLVDYWGDLAVDVQQCVGRWVPLSEADRSSIGTANSRLDVDLTVGEQVYDLSGAFNITIGPMDWATYLTFLPGEARYARTRALVELYCADPFSFTVELKLAAGEVPEMWLSSDENASRLGATSWVRTDEMPETSVTFDASSSAPLQASGESGEELAKAEASV